MAAPPRVVLLLAAALTVAIPAGAQVRVHPPVTGSPPTAASHAPGGVPDPASVLWIGAHPDDETLVAPLLERWCNAGGVRCAFLIATRGERGPCLLPDGCLPDLATIRAAEAAAAAQYFGADLILLSLPDGGGAAPPPWASDRDVAAAIAGFIRAEAPELVLTFDPRHGTSCHPDHRAVGALVLDAMALLTPPPALWFFETRTDVFPDVPAIRVFAGAPGTIRYDANERAGSGAPAWSAVEEVMERHASQFDAAWRAAVLRVPESDRAVFLAPASAILTAPVAVCR